MTGVQTCALPICFPVTIVGGWPIGSLGDYFGLPTVGQVGAAKDVSHSALPLRAYNLIIMSGSVIRIFVFLC